MNENLNLVEILKDCPKGTKLYSTVFGEVELDHIEGRANYQIVIKLKNGNGHESLTKEGKLFLEFDGECILFPSREQRDWSKFKVKKPKFDPKTLHPFERVLVRDENTDYWRCDFFSYVDDDEVYKYVCIKSVYKRCIPYNDETKHLVGTIDEAPEYYRH